MTFPKIAWPFQRELSNRYVVGTFASYVAAESGSPNVAEGQEYVDLTGYAKCCKLDWSEAASTCLRWNVEIFKHPLNDDEHRFFVRYEDFKRVEPELLLRSLAQSHNRLAAMERELAAAGKPSAKRKRSR
ncbi:MAG: hypothetical protein H6839_02740 [Planctomycetes bacterium]|nr:hypothetical protein [Planctomycetota bacterium]